MFDVYSRGFEEDEGLRSDFIRFLTMQQMTEAHNLDLPEISSTPAIPKVLIRYWDNPDALPDDVRACLESWDRLRDEGFELHMFSDASAAMYIASAYGARRLEAFAHCRHPAMRCDYLRLCFILAEGGFYVDADDVLLGDGWKALFRDNRLKLQPLCYDIPTSRMLDAS